MPVPNNRKRDCYTTGIQRIGENRVSKMFGANATIEFEKARALEQSLAGSGFAAPKPLACDASAGSVEFEYIDNTTRFFDEIVNAHATGDLVSVQKCNRDAAELLVLVHNKLRLTSSVAWEPSVELLGKLARAGRTWPNYDHVQLHCDFSPVNVLITSEGKLVLIDASPNQYFTERTDLVGPRLIDVATYTTKLFWPFRTRTFTPRWRRMARAMRTEFLEVYERASGEQLDRKILAILECEIVRSFVNSKTTSAAISVPAMLLARIALPS